MESHLKKIRTFALVFIFSSALCFAGYETGSPDQVLVQPHTAGQRPQFGQVDLSKSAAVKNQLSGSNRGVPPTVEFLTAASGTYFLDYVFLISSGSATIGATYSNNSFVFTVYKTVASATQIVMTGTGSPSASGVLTKTSGTGDATLTFSQSIAPSSLFIKTVGGGGGAAGSYTSGPNNGSAGGTTTFGSSLITANPGSGGGGTAAGTGGTGGSVNSPAYLVTQISGADGTASLGYPGAQTAGGNGGSSPLGGAGMGRFDGSAANAKAGSGSGGGSGTMNTAGSLSGGAGGAGEWIEAIIPNPISTGYAFVNGAGGAGGAAGANGFPGGSGATASTTVIATY